MEGSFWHQDESWGTGAMLNAGASERPRSRRSGRIFSKGTQYSQHLYMLAQKLVSTEYASKNFDRPIELVLSRQREQQTIT